MERWIACALVLGLVTAGCGSDENPPAAGDTGGAGGISGSGGSAAGSGGAAGIKDASAGSGGAAGAKDASAGSGGAAGAKDGSPGTGGAPGADGAAGSGGVSPTGALPEGNNGIAARHAGDVGIATDSDVLFADDFESYASSSQLDQKWTYSYQNQYLAIVTAAANVYAGTKALEFTIPQQSAELSDGVDKDISPEQDVLFFRYYGKIMAPYDVVGSSHNGSGISAHYFLANNQSTPGIPANGTNKFLANMEMWRGDTSTASPGQLNMYVYHPLQRSNYGDHFFPDGLVMPNTSLAFDFGSSFVARSNIIPQLDRWYCYEMMIRANTPGQKDGRIAGWLDGVLVMDFMNLRLRDVATLTINRVGVGLHIGSNPNGVAKKWCDNVVVAKSYIGPLVP